jgi:class 3 adenylate cyclase
LNECFKTFEEITNKYGIEKIKTVGDGYHAVAGLPKADPRHAENIVMAAKEISAFMADRLSKLGKEHAFGIRIGVHSGSLVAGIVGVKKFQYDIMGDTVNTAARMEQNCEAGKINISEKTYELVKDKFSCEYRGEVEAKGKGMMKMYYVG